MRKRLSSVGDAACWSSRRHIYLTVGFRRPLYSNILLDSGNLFDYSTRLKKGRQIRPQVGDVDRSASIAAQRSESIS